MEHKQAALDLADFLDSPEAARVATVRRADLRRIAEAFLAACYEDLGKKPNLLDGQDVEVVLRQLLPGRLAPKDPAAEHLPAVLAAFVDHLEATRVVSQAFEIRRALGEGLPAFVERVRSGRNAGQQVAAPAKPVVYGAPKLGRNDPCSCGSGKKYKKCHGANA